MNTKDNKIIITIEGNIGVGKSTFTKILQDTFLNSLTVNEPVDIWLNTTNKEGDNILGIFYSDIKRWAYSFQNFAYVTRMMKIQDAINSDNNILFLDRSIGTDRYVFEKMLYDDGFVSEIEHKMYETWCDFYKNYVNNCNNWKHIYLRCTPQIAIERIKKRGREEEKNITLEYLTKIHSYHEAWLNSSTNTLIIDCDRDFESDKIFQDEIINKIKNNFF